MADKFGLDNLRNGVKKRAAELSDDANVRSLDDTSTQDSGPFKPYTFKQENFDRTEPDKDDMRKYWRQFETTPFVRKSISSFSRQVMEPGYYIKARGLDEDDLTKLDNWLSNAAIVGTERNQDFRQLAKKIIVQQEVRGTGFAEIAPDKNDPEKIGGLKLMNAETMEAVTRPGQSILLDPDDINEFEDAPEAESGGAAAWLQDLGETDALFGTPVRGRDRNLDTDDDEADIKIGFKEDEVIRMARDADIGEAFGTSRIEAVSDRIEGLRNKLSDNDDAIASKAYPLWLFLFGSEENPWESDDINEFMKSHEMENFHSGMKQGVRGDVNIETVSGEVADIADALQFDIEWIMSIMPIPRFALGAFTGDAGGAGQFGGVAQTQETQRQIKDARRDLEDKFSPVVQQVAKQIGVDEDAAKTIRLMIGEPGEPEPEVPQNENVIRYVPKDQRTPNAPRDTQTESPGNEGVPSEVAPSEEPQDAPEEASSQVWHTDQGIAELSMSGNSELSDAIYSVMVETRNQTLDEISQDFENAPIYAATNFEQKANSVLKENMSRGTLRDDIRSVVENLVSDDENSFSRQNSVRFFVQNIENATRDSLEEMLRLMRIQVRRGASQGSELSDVINRTRNKYDDANLRQRAELIAHMESKNIEETVALQRYEADDEVIGVRVVNENPSTPLTQSLNGVEVYFEDGDIQSQLADSTRPEFLHSGFDPLPATPPFHFNDSTSLEPIRKDS